ncbi:MAG: hypothetical protein HOC70_02730 [Gammaproteobacteria bacterium]|nr:hypothetical protein [Gammaproteobacteria bacterium]MBT4492130.1 hypothetical protein [Gammaproteobacteria bacterium]
MESGELNQQLIEAIYAAGSQWSLAITGGGTSAISDLFAVPGASGTILEARVPYHADLLKSYLGARSDPGCSTSTARAMAMQAYLAASAIGSKPAFGLGCTAAIATNRERRGSDRCHLAVQSYSMTRTFDVTFDKALSRQEQEQICRDLVINAMATALNLPCESVKGNSHTASRVWQSLLDGEIGKTSDVEYAAIFPGAFNPLHEGHQQMLSCARDCIDGEIALEISISNVDKPPLDFLSMAERTRQLEALPLVFTNAPTFVEKAALFPGTTFIVGLDTLLRIEDARYYDSAYDRDQAIDEMANLGNRFLVFGREINDKFQTLNGLELTPALRALCTEIEEAQFRSDISSTEIREGDR